MSPGYACEITAIWEPRAEMPAALARRFLSLTDRLKTIDPVFSQWYVWTSETTEMPLDLLLEVLARKIVQTADLDVNGAPVPELGYRRVCRNLLPLIFNDFRRTYGSSVQHQTRHR